MEFWKMIETLATLPKEAREEIDVVIGKYKTQPSVKKEWKMMKSFQPRYEQQEFLAIF